MKTKDGKPLSNTQRAVLALRDLIFRGELPAGSDHLESELAERFGMSRTPVREAALILESQGLLELRPRKGIRVQPVSTEDMAEIYDVLTELESHAAECAAMRGLGAADLRALGRAIDDMDKALAGNDLEAWAEADDRFHQELVRLGGNSRIMAIVGMMNDQVRRVRQMTLFIRPVPTQSNSDHRRVHDAIRTGDAAVARDIHRQHRQAAKAMLLRLLDTHRLSRL